MNENTYFGLCWLVLLGLIAVALFSGPKKFQADEGFLMEWEPQWEQRQQQAQAPPVGRAMQGAGWSQYLYQPVFPLDTSASPLIGGQENPPQLIKELGIEVVEVSGGKVKITGVMGNSWAAKAGLRSKDIILSFDHKRIDGLGSFQALVQQAVPERDYRIKVLRGDRVKSLLVTVGEGEMEGFTPIASTALAGRAQRTYGCPNCGNAVMHICPSCGVLLNPM